MDTENLVYGMQLFVLLLYKIFHCVMCQVQICFCCRESSSNTKLVVKLFVFVLDLARDIIKRSVISRFSAAASSVLDFQPISLFSWPTKGISHDKDVMKGCVRKLEEATMMWFSRNTGANISYPREGEDIAVWLLIRTSSESDGQSTCYSHNCHFDSDGCWRPGLLIKNTVILGSALYTRYFLWFSSYSCSIILYVLLYPQLESSFRTES